MKPAIQTPDVEKDYEAFSGKPYTVTYYHWGQRRWITRTVFDPAVRRRTAKRAPTGYSPIKPIKREE